MTVVVDPHVSAAARTAAPPDDSRPLIAHVVHHLGRGELQHSVVDLIDRLPRERYRHAVIMLTDATIRLGAWRDDVPVFALDDLPGRTGKLAPRLYALFGSLKPAIVHTRNVAALEANAPAVAAGVPIRIHGEHGGDVDDSGGIGRKHRLVRRAYRPFVNQHIASSRRLAEYLIRAVGVPPQRVAQIDGGVDTVRLTPRDAERVPIAGCPFVDPDLWLLGAVATPVERDGYLTLAHAFGQLVSTDSLARDRLRLIVVGDRALRDAIAVVLTQLRCADLAWLVEPSDERADLLRGLDVYVSPAFFDGDAHLILEAMAAGLPVVATEVGSCAEMVDDGNTGELVPANDAVRLADALRKSLHDRADARRQGNNGRRVVETRFNVDRMVADYAAVYDTWLKRRGSTVAAALPASFR